MENGAEREGVESVMSRNLGVPRIYSNRGGEGREFAVVIRGGSRYGHGWLNWRMVFRFSFGSFSEEGRRGEAG